MIIRLNNYESIQMNFVFKNITMDNLSFKKYNFKDKENLQI